MNIAINTDFFEDVNSPELYLQLASEVGGSLVGLSPDLLDTMLSWGM